MISYFDWFIPGGTPEDLISALEELKKVEGIDFLETGNLFYNESPEKGVIIRVMIGFIANLEVIQSILKIYAKSLKDKNDLNICQCYELLHNRMDFAIYKQDVPFEKLAFHTIDLHTCKYQSLNNDIILKPCKYIKQGDKNIWDVLKENFKDGRGDYFAGYSELAIWKAPENISSCGCGSDEEKWYRSFCEFRADGKEWYRRFYNSLLRGHFWSYDYYYKVPFDGRSDRRCEDHGSKDGVHEEYWPKFYYDENFLDPTKPGKYKGESSYCDNYTNKPFKYTNKPTYSFWNPLKNPIDSEFDERARSTYLEGLCHIAPIFLRGTIGGKVILLDGTAFRYTDSRETPKDTILKLKEKFKKDKSSLPEGSELPYAYLAEGSNFVGRLKSEEKNILQILQMIHAAWFKETGNFPGKVYVSLAPKRGGYETQFFNLLEEILKFSAGQVVILDYMGRDSAGKYFDYSNSPEFIEILKEYVGSCQIVITCHGRENVSNDDDDELEEPSPYDAMLESLQQNHVPLNTVGTFLPDMSNAALWDVDSIKEILTSCKEDTQKLMRGKEKRFLKQWQKQPIGTPLTKSLNDFIYEEKNELDVKAMSNRLEEVIETYGANSIEAKSIRLLMDVYKQKVGNKEYELITRDWGKDAEAFCGKDTSKVLQPGMANYLDILYACDSDLGDKPHLCICGNAGSGKSTAAKLIAMDMFLMCCVEDKNYTLLQASSLIAQFVGQTAPRVANAFKQAKGRVLIIEGIDNLLYQNDYGEQALDEIGYQMENCGDDTIVILTGEEADLMKIFSRFPKINSKIGHTIHLKDYNFLELEDIIQMKLSQSCSEDLDDEVINAAFDKLQEKYLKKSACDSVGLKFNLTSNVSFDDVIGNKKAKSELQQIANHIGKNDGYILPKGVLLSGSPGTGKTLLAKAFANEAKVPFCSVPVSYFTDTRNNSAERVQKLFQEARKRGSCVIFIDEIESLVPSRDTGYSSPLLSQLLIEMDGFDNNQGIIILAATNHPEQIDSAIKRPGRFDRQIAVELPRIEDLSTLYSHYISKAIGRNTTPDTTEKPNKSANGGSDTNESIYSQRLQKYVRLVAGGDCDRDDDSGIGLLLSNGHFAEDVANALTEEYKLKKHGIPLNQPKSIPQTKSSEWIDNKDVDIDSLAQKTFGHSGAEVKAIVDKAVNIAIEQKDKRDGRLILTQDDLQAAITYITDLTRLDFPLSYGEQERTAYHETGHAIMAVMTMEKDERGNPTVNPISKVSIVPHIGYAGMTDVNQKSTHITKRMMEAQLKQAVAGRAIEELIYGSDGVSCGCESDMEEAKKIILEMLTRYGFDEEVGFLPLEYSKATEQQKEKAYMRGNLLLKDIYESTKNELETYLPQIKEFVPELIKRQEISGDEFVQIFLDVMKASTES